MSARRKPAIGVDAEADTRYLHYWLLTAIFFEYARPTGFVPGLSALPFNSLIPLTLVIVCMFVRGLRSGREIFADPLSKWIFIYFGLICLSIVHAEVTLYAYTVIRTVLGYVLLFFLIVRIATTEGRIRGVLVTLVLAHLFLLVMNPEAVLNPQERHYIKGGTFLGDGNDFSLSACMLLPMATELALSSTTRLWRICWWLVLLVLVLAIIGTSSRGGTLGMIGVAAYVWLRSPRKVLTLAGVAVAVAVLFLYAPETYFRRMSTMSDYETDSSAMSRIIAWKTGMRMFVDNPILGVAAGNFASAYGGKYRPAEAETNKWMTAHSMYFLILGELALPGIVTFLVLIFGNMRANTRLRRQIERKLATGPPTQASTLGAARLLYLLNASMVGFAVAGAFLSVAYYPHIFVLTGLMVSARSILRQQAGLAAPVAVGTRSRLAAARQPVQRGTHAQSRQDISEQKGSVRHEGRHRPGVG